MMDKDAKPTFQIKGILPFSLKEISRLITNNVMIIGALATSIFSMWKNRNTRRIMCHGFNK
jgi:hypothetical protein